MQGNFLPNYISRTISGLLYCCFIVSGIGGCLCLKGLSVECCNRIFTINSMGQFSFVTRLNRMRCSSCSFCNCAVSRSIYRYCIFVFTMNMRIRIDCCKVLGIGICFLSRSVCKILISSDTGQLHIFQCYLCFGSAAKLRFGIKAIEIVVYPTNAYYIRQICICHFGSCLLIGCTRCISIGLPGQFQSTGIILLESNIFIFCKTWICRRFRHRIKQFYLLVLVSGFIRNSIGFCQFKSTVIVNASFLFLFFQERYLYRIGVTKMSSFLIQITNRKRCTLAVIVLLEVV